MTTERLSDAVNVSRLLEDLARQLNGAGISEPFSESREIVAALYDVPRFWPLMNGNLDVDVETLSRARTAVEKRIQGAPLATHQLGHQRRATHVDLQREQTAGRQHIRRLAHELGRRSQTIGPAEQRDSRLPVSNTRRQRRRFTKRNVRRV